MKPANTFPLLLQAFFLQWLGQQRNCSAKRGITSHTRLQVHLSSALIAVSFRNHH